MVLTGVRVELPWIFHTVKKLPFAFIQSALHTRERFWDYGDQSIANLKDYVEHAGADASKSFFAQFLDPKKPEQRLTEKQLSSEAANMIVAGADTTAVTLTYLIWVVCHPSYSHIRRRLMEEIEPLPIDARVAELYELKYLRNLVHEILRLYGSASGSMPRSPPKGGAIVGGYEVPDWAAVSVQNYSLSKMDEIYADALR
jgi:cytochrome P450